MGLITQVMKNANDDDTWTSIGFQTLLILNKLKTSTEIEDLKKRNVSKNDHGHGDPNAERADEHERGKLANIR